ncbi:MAG: Rossmann-like and DUF2520 domain-containing protein [Bacteroidota bacterium]
MNTILIGAGNLAFHLGQRLQKLPSVNITQVFSRDLQKAKELAHFLSCNAINSLEQVKGDAEWYILAVSDGAIQKVAQALATKVHAKALVVHTSGATPGSIFVPYFKRYGVFYPLQSFSRQREVAFDQIPICVYANHEDDQNNLLKIGKLISEKVQVIDDFQRAQLHVAAVFANNFTNSLLENAYALCEEANIPFDILIPLIRESINKVENNRPIDVQTGPASRGDATTILRHLQLLENKTDLQKVYKLLSLQINPKLEFE